MRSLVSAVVVAVVSPVVDVRATVASQVAVVQLLVNQVVVAPVTAVIPVAVTLAASHVVAFLPNCVPVTLLVRLPAAAASPVVVAPAIAASQAVDVRLLTRQVAVAVAEHS
jgi:hypothetical protein